MKQNNITSQINNKVSIVVHSCDKYEDLWLPFFTLLKKYWTPLNIPIVLNTETKSFIMEGLDIECIHPKKANVPYGARMLNVLSKIRTPYVIPLLDDFFLRDYVDVDMINKIISWMEEDKKIACFNCDCAAIYADWEKEKYPGFQRVPYGCEHTINMQAAVWRKKSLIKYWRPNVSPWEWESYCNLVAAKNRKDKFYCVTELGNGFCEYGIKMSGWGVIGGKWFIDDVAPLFEKEDIHIDFAKRGVLHSYDKNANSPLCEPFRQSLKNIKIQSSIINRCMPLRERISYAWFIKFNYMIKQFSFPEFIWIRYSLLKEKKKFFANLRRHERVEIIRKEGLIKYINRKMIRTR